MSFLFPVARTIRRRTCLLAIFAGFGCSRAADSETVAATATDDFGLALPVDARYAERVVSLNPAATEVIFAMGANGRLVGRSKWDEFPAEAKQVAPLGDGIRPNVEAILGVRPTLVILYATAENRAAADALTRAGVRTLALRVDHIGQFMALCRTLGVALDAAPRARQVADSVQRTLNRVRDAMRGAEPVTVVWPLWHSPVLAVGGGSYLDELLEIAGGRNVFHEMEAPSPPVSIEEIAKRDPERVLASAQAVQTIAATPSWRAVSAVREGRLGIIDPTLTGRPSVVLGMAAVSLARLLHPERAQQLTRALSGDSAFVASPTSAPVPERK